MELTVTSWSSSRLGLSGLGSTKLYNVLTSEYEKANNGYEGHSKKESSKGISIA